MAFLPTLFFVHAHPDDEVFFGAGAAAHYSSRGHRVVLVTCTSGQLGIDPSGRPGSDPRHNDDATKAIRAGELQHAASALGFSRIVTLGYDDSGMKGWAQNESPNAFMNADVHAVASVLAALMEQENASVVVTYDESGFYGHPDHIMANVVTRQAIARATSPTRLYYPVVPRSVLVRVQQGAHEMGQTTPAWIDDAATLVSDEDVATTLDVSAYIELKRQAIVAHASQIDNAPLVEMKHELFTLLFGVEHYQRAWSRLPASGDATDLYGGLTWD